MHVKDEKTHFSIYSSFVSKNLGILKRIVRIGDSYDFPILAFLRLLQFLGSDNQVPTHSKNRRRLGCLGQYLQSRNDSDSSDHIVKIADRLGFLG